MFSPRLASWGTGAGGGVCPLKGGGRVFRPVCPGGGGGRERGAGSSQNTCHLPWVTRYLLPMLSLHDQSRGPWILLHVVSGPWTFFVAALDKGQCRKAVCRRYTASSATVSEDAGIEPRTVATFSLAVRRSNHLARSHPLNLARSHPLNFARSHPLNLAKSHPLNLARSHPPLVRSYPHLAGSHSLWARSHTFG